MISIYETEDSDIDAMTFNKWAWEIKSAKEIRALKKYIKSQDTAAFTLYDDDKDKPVAILAFHEFAKGMVEGMIVADETFGDNPKYAIKMRWLVKRLIKDFKLVFVITISQDTEELNKWHKFLGFIPMRKLPKYRKDTDFILWGM